MVACHMLQNIVNEVSVQFKTWRNRIMIDD